jgi:hypothetical protein
VKVRGITAARMRRSGPPGVGLLCGRFMRGSYTSKTERDKLPLHRLLPCTLTQVPPMAAAENFRPFKRKTPRLEWHDNQTQMLDKPYKNTTQTLYTK